MSSPAIHPQSAPGAVDSDKAARALYALLELSKALSSVVDLDHLLTVIVEKASAVVDAERTSVFIYDADKDRLWSRVAQGIESGTIELPLGTGIVGEVARTRRLANIPDAYRDPRFNREPDQKTGFRTCAILCAPVIDSKGNLLAVIESINKAVGPQFDEHDEMLMHALAAHVAVAIERARATDIQIDNERFEQSLRLANAIQMRMLPSGTVTLPDSAAFALHAHIRPARQVGGDLYDFFWTDDRLAFCIGDVTGKGIGAALVMAVTKTLFRAHAALQTSPAKLMSAANAHLYEETDPTMFVTAFCGFLDLRTGRLRYSNAGHDRPLIVANGKPVQRLQSKSGLPLGVLHDFSYVVEEITLEPGDALFLYTDGVTEATNRAEELFSMERLRGVLDARTSQEPPELIRSVLANVDRFAEGTAQADDITMLCLQFRGAENLGKFRRDMADLDRVFEFVGRFVSDRSIDLAVEEIFTNFVRHNAEGAGNIEIRLRRADNDVTIVLIDRDTPKFDMMPEPDVTQPLEERTPGGLGLFLTRKMMDRVDYKHENRVGIVTLHKKVG